MSGATKWQLHWGLFKIKLCFLSYYCYLVCCVYLFIFPAFTALARIFVYIVMHYFESTQFTTYDKWGSNGTIQLSFDCLLGSG